MTGVSFGYWGEGCKWTARPAFGPTDFWCYFSSFLPPSVPCQRTPRLYRQSDQGTSVCIQNSGREIQPCASKRQRGRIRRVSGETRRRISLLDQSDFPNNDDLKRAVAVCTCIKTSWLLFPPILTLSISISLIILTGGFIFYFQGYSKASSFKSIHRQTCITQPRHLHLLSSPSSLASMPRPSQPASLFAAHPLHPALAGIALE